MVWEVRGVEEEVRPGGWKKRSLKKMVGHEDHEGVRFTPKGAVSLK